jgi:hypothetical protein
MTDIEKNILIPAQVSQFDPSSKTWVYQSSRPFNDDELIKIQTEIDQFTKQWTAHNMELRAAGFVFAKRVIVLMVDESHTGASGCAIDKSLHFIQGIEADYGVELFDRMLVHYADENGWHTTKLSLLSDLIAQNLITKHTRVLDPMVYTKSDYEGRFVTTIADCWMTQFV